MTVIARFQFSVVHLLFLTTIVAAALGLIRWFDLPDELFRYLLWSYAIFFGLWLAIRGPAVLSGLSEVTQRRRDILRRRQQLAREIESRRTDLAAKRRAAPDAAAPTDEV
jgi:hypothetical protein